MACRTERCIIASIRFVDRVLLEINKIWQRYKEPIYRAVRLCYRITTVLFFITLPHFVIYQAGLYQRLVSFEWYRIISNSPYTVDPPPIAQLLLHGTIVSYSLLGVAVAYSAWRATSVPTPGDLQMGNLIGPVYGLKRVLPRITYLCLVASSAWWLRLLVWETQSQPALGMVLAALSLGLCAGCVWSVCAFNEPLAMLATVAVLHFMFGLNVTAALGWGNQDKTGEDKLYVRLVLNREDMSLVVMQPEAEWMDKY